jgi:PAS domain S-box-containing protein
MKKLKRPARKEKRSTHNGATRGSKGRDSNSSVHGLPHPKTELESAIQRFVDLYDFAPIAYVSFDRAGRIEEANLAATELLGQPRDLLIGRPFAFYVADLDLFLRHLLYCRTSQQQVKTELPLKPRRGEQIPALLFSTPITSTAKNGALLYQTAIVDLRERKEAEAELRESERRYRTLFDLVPVAVYACDAKGIIQEYNRRAAELWGREPSRNGAERRFCGSYKIYYPDGRFMPHEDCPMARALRGETLESKDLEIIVERPDGTRRSVIPAPEILKNDAGKIIGAINCLYDITEHKKNQQALADLARQQEALYRFVERRSNAISLDEIYEAALDTILETLLCDRASVLLFDEQHVIRFVYWRGLSARCRKAVEGHSPWKPNAKNPQPVCIADVDLSDIPQELKKTLKSEGIGAAAFIPLMAEGKLIGTFVTYYNSPHVFTHEEIAVALNIGGQLALGIERKRAETGLRESEERLRAIVEQATAGMARSDLSGRLLFVNQKFCEMLGYEESELIGKHIHEFTYRADGKKAADLFDRLVKQAKSYETEKRYVREDGSTVWASVSASPIRDVQGKVKSAVIVVVDITSRKKAEAALRRSRELLEELVQQRTNALHAANVELQNEINLRKGLEEQILEISDREQQRLARELHDGLCQQLTAIGFMARATALRLKNHRVVQVEDLEKIAQLITNSVMDARGIARDLHKEEVDAAGLAEVLRALSERKIWRIPCRFDLKTELNIEDDRVASQLYRILREALMNANKHANATQLVLEVRRRKNDLIFAVTDNGVGFSAKTKTGRGLGLHIMQYRAQSIGARLKLESPRNGGARVVCSLPSQNEIRETK